jgi:hypothetical protein
MARDMYLVKQNIVKLVKLQGGTPQTKSGDWFSRQQARENAYESRYNKTKTSPSKVEKKEEKSGGGFLGGVLSIIGGVASAFGGFLTTLGVAGTLLFSFGGIIARILGWLVKGPLGVLLGLSAFMGAKSLMSDSKDTGTSGDSSIMNSVIKSDTTKTVVDTAAGVGGAMAVGSAVSGVAKGVGAAKATGEAILDARTMSVGQMAKSSPKSTWGKFLAFVARKSPALWGRVALKLAQAGALAAIPIIGWIGAAIQLGFSLWTAWEIYELWKEFNNMREEAENTSPEPVPTPEAYHNDGGFKLNSGNTADYYGNAGMKPPTSPSRSNGFNDSGAGSNTSGGSGGMTFNQLSREQQDALLAEQRKQEGFKPGSLSYDLNNPGNIQYTERAKQFGGVRDTTGRGVGSHKGTFAKFPTLADGVEAQRDLWSRKYGNVPLEQAIKKWAPDAGPSYSQNIIAAATSGKSSGLTPTASNNNDSKVTGSQLTSYSTALETAKRESAQSAPVNIDASTKTTQAGGGNQISLPASGVIDTELAKLLVERAVG